LPKGAVPRKLRLAPHGSRWMVRGRQGPSWRAVVPTERGMSSGRATRVNTVSPGGKARQMAVGHDITKF
jgi:hypothetical protein